MSSFIVFPPNPSIFIFTSLSITQEKSFIILFLISYKAMLNQINSMIKHKFHIFHRIKQK